MLRLVVKRRSGIHKWEVKNNKFQRGFLVSYTFERQPIANLVTYSNRSCAQNQKKIYVMLNFLIYVDIQILLAFWILHELW